MDKKIKVSSPGKIILSGEHSIVYGYPAVLTAITKRLFVEVLKCDKSEIIIDDNSFGKKEFSIRKLREFFEESNKAFRFFQESGDINCLSFIKNDPFSLVKLAIAGFFKESGKSQDSFSLEIKSEIPVGSGMGSSAALSVATLGALFALTRNSFPKEEINRLAFEVEKKIHGRPSGGDNTIVTYGGLLVFQKGKGFKKIILKNNLDFDFLVIQTGKPRESTGEMVALVNSKLKIKNEKLKIERSLKSIGQVTNKVIQSFKSEDFSQLKRLIWQNERLLERLGVVSEETKRLIRELENQKVAAKICGAGGVKENSGIVLVLVDDFKKLEGFLGRKKLENFRTKINQEGVRVEKN